MSEDIIPIDKMENYCIYKCNARNFSYGIWYNGKMWGIRSKFGDEFIDSEFHYETENNGTCKPIEKITESLKNRLDDSMFSVMN